MFGYGYQLAIDIDWKMFTNKYILNKKLSAEKGE